MSERIETALASEANVRELEAKVTQQKALIVKLEEDILKVGLPTATSDWLNSLYCVQTYAKR